MRNFKHEYDEKTDVMTVFYSEHEAFKSAEILVMGSKHVLYEDAEGNLVRAEFHGFSKMKERAKNSKRETFTADSSKQEPIGSVHWIAFEKGNDEQIAEGHLEPKLSDVSIELTDRDGSPQIKKSIPLSNEFSLAVCGSSPQSDPLTGFALQALRSDKKAFCWEWFVVESPGHAKKLQESGTLEFTTEIYNRMNQITKTTFPTDVSLRVVRMDVKPDPKQPDWRVNILKGSTITWPSLVDGRVEL